MLWTNLVEANGLAINTVYAQISAGLSFFKAFAHLCVALSLAATFCTPLTELCLGSYNTINLMNNIEYVIYFTSLHLPTINA